VKKFGWPPDIIHCHGWMTSLIPFYLRTAYNNEPLFQDSKVVYSLYQDGPEDHIDPEFALKASINALMEEDLAPYMNNGKPDLHAGAVRFADAVIKGTAEINEHNTALLAGLEIPVLDVQGEEAPQASVEFYHSLLEEEVAK
ncbi:MAG: glycogen/starch synthase, partial [Bacteroidota bacterium]